MSMIGKKLPEFKADYYQAGELKQLTHEDVLGKWAVFFFYPADFTFVCPTELADVADHYEKLQELGCEVTVFRPIRISFTWRGRKNPRAFRKSNTK